MLRDDGYIQAGVPWPNPRFTDHGDGTVSDNLTGLMWTKDCNTPMLGTYEPVKKKHWWSVVPKTLTPGSCEGGQMNWEKAFNYVNCLNAANYLGHNDWRLPNINELESLLIYGRLDKDGLRDVEALPLPTIPNYWSSTTTEKDSSFAWILGNPFGAIKTKFKSLNEVCVWPVRGGQSGAFRNAALWITGQTESYHPGDDGDVKAGVPWSNPRFTDHGDGTVSDNLTGLMWTKDANLPANSIHLRHKIVGILDVKTSQGALEYVDTMNTGAGTYGYNDWRLPNIKEIRSLVDYSRHACALPQEHPFINVKSNFYWSSSPCKHQFSLAWIVNMRDGRTGCGVRLGSGIEPCAEYLEGGGGNNKFYVWPVRAGVLEKGQV